MKTEHTPTPWTPEIINNCPDSEEKANQEFMLRAVNEYSDDKERILKLEVLYKSARSEANNLADVNKALLKAAKEMFSLLSKKPNGPLWPTEEEFNRDYISWSQVIALAEEKVQS